MTNKAILVVHSENITLKTTETDKKPIFVQCPRVTNMMNVMYPNRLQNPSKSFQNACKSSQTKDITNSVLHNIFICQSNKNHSTEQTNCTLFIIIRICVSTQPPTRPSHLQALHVSFCSSMFSEK